MSERAAFIHAILDSPTDDTARLVFADWLEERGELERAEFIRVQIEAERRPGAAHEKSAPGKRADALLQAHQGAWLSAVGLGPADGRYERGFLTGVTFEVPEFETRALLLLTREPADVRLLLRHRHGKTATLDDVGALAASPLLRGISVLDNKGHWFGARRFARLMKSPHLRNLREITISEDPLGAAGVRAIANAPAAFDLEVLSLDEALDDDTDGQNKAIWLIATSPRFASLQYLSLMFNSLNADHIRVLLASKTLPRTLLIQLDDNDFDERLFADDLAERFTGGSDRLKATAGSEL